MNSLNTLTTIPENYFGGVSPSGYITNSSQDRLFHRISDGLFWESEDVTGLRLKYQLQVSYKPTGIESGHLCSLDRLKCHVLLDVIPDEGLSEIMESLRNAFEYYAFRPRHESRPSLPTRSIRMTLGNRRERPAIELSEE